MSRLRVYVLFTLCLIGVVLLGVVGYRFFASDSENTSTQPNSSQPFGGSTVPSAPVTSGAVEDFTEGRPSIQLDAGTYYYVTQDKEGTEGDSRYGIVHGADASVSIGLFEEPLGEARLAAEEKLKSLFPQRPESDFCRMSLTVTVPFDVSEYYAGENLGLSFCPGSVALPD